MAAAGEGARTLFEVVTEARRVAGGEVCASAGGAAAEYAAIGMLLDRGHKVAVPVVDDDGVDLIVDYRTLVQVKTTGQANSSGTPTLQFKRNSYRRRRDGTRVVRSSGVPRHVDVLLVRVNGVGWYVVPRDLAPESGLTFGPGMDQWREAWEVFD